MIDLVDYTCPSRKTALGDNDKILATDGDNVYMLDEIPIRIGNTTVQWSDAVGKSDCNLISAVFFDQKRIDKEQESALIVELYSNGFKTFSLYKLSDESCLRLDDNLFSKTQIIQIPTNSDDFDAYCIKIDQSIFENLGEGMYMIYLDFYPINRVLQPMFFIPKP